MTHRTVWGGRGAYDTVSPAAAVCHRCRATNSLRWTGGTFACRDLILCAARVELQAWLDPELDRLL